jgi:hypothetical protein
MTALIQLPERLEAKVKPCKCNNPDHPVGCPFGSRLVECSEDEAHTWVASICFGGVQFWGSDGVESQSREAATAALLERLAQGVFLSMPEPDERRWRLPLCLLAICVALAIAFLITSGARPLSYDAWLAGAAQ